MHTVEMTVYDFAALSDAAKESARDWYRGLIEADEITDDYMSNDWQSVAEILGVSFDTHSVRLMSGGTRQDLTIYWEFDPVSCAFNGSYAYAKGAPRAIRAYAPQDIELHRIADELQAVQRRAFYRLTATCSTGGRNGTSQNVQIDMADDSAVPSDAEDTLWQLLSDFAHWIGRQIEAQRDYLFSDEAVDEMIEANGYAFDEDGRPA